MIEIIPAIDLSGGQVVRLKRGAFEEKTIYSPDPLEVARKFEQAGATRLHVVDLDGAKSGEIVHFDVIQKIASTVGIPLEVGGGMRSRELAAKMAGVRGVDRVILGTAAVENPIALKHILDDLGPAKVVLSVDVKNGKVATRGWLSESESDPVSFGRAAYETGLRISVYTDVKQDGMMKGPNIGATSLFAKETGLSVVVSGGVSSLADIDRVIAEKNPNIIGIIIGRAIYEGAVDVAEAVKRVC